MVLLLVGGIMLFCYGVVLNQAPFDFGRLIGAYVATFFVVGQVINLVAFGTPPSLPVTVGGLLIIIGGAVITYGTAPPEAGPDRRHQERPQSPCIDYVGDCFAARNDSKPREIFVHHCLFPPHRP